ncbi:hypothetical protein BH24ACI5_BH24ACI5_10680 [soil metagenome]
MHYYDRWARAIADGDLASTSVGPLVHDFSNAQPAAAHAIQR